jgi:TniQ
MLDTGIQPWLFQVEPYEGESLSHFLGRFRRPNHLTPSGLGQLASIGAVVARWERFHLNPFPSEQELAALALVVGVSATQLREMLPPQGVSMKCTPIRLCPDCCAEKPYHRIEWQYQAVWKCDRHDRKLLAKCPNCGAKFKSPSPWEAASCHRCGLPFGNLFSGLTD